MELVKVKLSVIERLRFIRGSLTWLPLTCIPNLEIDEHKWTIEPFSLRERLECFWSEFSTGLVYGYVYKFEDEKGEDN